MLYTIVDNQNRKVCEIVDFKESGGGIYIARIVNVETIPKNLLLIWREIEQLVNDQCFAVLDSLEDQLRGYGLRLYPMNTPIYCSSIFSTDRISFQFHQ